MTEKEFHVQCALGTLIKYPFTGTFTFEDVSYSWSITVFAINDENAVEQVEVMVNAKFSEMLGPIGGHITVNADIDPERLRHRN